MKVIESYRASPLEVNDWCERLVGCFKTALLYDREGVRLVGLERCFG